MGDVVSMLNISAVAVEDGGRYTCRAINSLGETSHSARLNIYGRFPHYATMARVQHRVQSLISSITAGPPLVRTTPPLQVVAGSDTSIFCPYAGYPIRSVEVHLLADGLL